MHACSHFERPLDPPVPPPPLPDEALDEEEAVVVVVVDELVSSSPQATAVKAAPANGAPKRPVAAIFVKNRGCEIAPEKVMVLEDFLVARVGELCYTTMSREDMLNAVKRFASAGANAGTVQDVELEADRFQHLRYDEAQFRTETGAVLAEGAVPVTTLRAAMVIGQHSASFQMLRDLVHRLPAMVTPPSARATRA